ncbi:hypothetical protein THAOC_17784, partial [Thalassiosira oceanica]
GEQGDGERAAVGARGFHRECDRAKLHTRPRGAAGFQRQFGSTMALILESCKSVREHDYQASSLIAPYANFATNRCLSEIRLSSRAGLAKSAERNESIAQQYVPKYGNNYKWRV